MVNTPAIVVQHWSLLGKGIENSTVVGSGVRQYMFEPLLTVGIWFGLIVTTTFVLSSAYGIITQSPKCLYVQSILYRGGDEAG